VGLGLFLSTAPEPGLLTAEDFLKEMDESTGILRLIRSVL